jgi:hypothetical protein
MSSNPPTKHHFIAQFLLSAWTGSDGKLWRFTNPLMGNFAAKHVAPADLCYEKHHYTTPDEPYERAQQIEQVLMALLDDRTSTAHQMLLGGEIDAMGLHERSAWSRFIMSLWFRTPDGVRSLKDATAALLGIDDRQIAEAYQARHQQGNAATWVEAVAQVGPHLADRAAMHVLLQQVDNPTNSQLLNDMYWAVLDVTGPRDLMVSDAVLAQTGDIFGPEGYLAMPISPRRLFFASRTRARLDAFKGLAPATIIALINHAVVRRARNFVGATVRAEIDFVRANFASDLCPGLPEILARPYQAAAA